MKLGVPRQLMAVLYMLCLLLLLPNVQSCSSWCLLLLLWLQMRGQLASI